MKEDKFKEEIGLKIYRKREMLEANSKSGLVQGTGDNEGMAKGEMRKTQTRWEDGFKVVLKGQTDSDPQ